MLEHSIKAKLGNHESAQWVMKAEADVAKYLTAADDPIKKIGWEDGEEDN